MVFIDKQTDRQTCRQAADRRPGGRRTNRQAGRQAIPLCADVQSPIAEGNRCLLFYLCLFCHAATDYLAPFLHRWHRERERATRRTTWTHWSFMFCCVYIPLRESGSAGGVDLANITRMQRTSQNIGLEGSRL